jgi:hypothetical protein
MRNTVRITKGLRSEIVKAFADYDRRKIDSTVRTLTAIENGRTNRDGSQELALSPEEQMALASILEKCADEWESRLPYASSGDRLFYQKCLTQFGDIALQAGQAMRAERTRLAAR